jgi:hypothetical protein
MYPKYCKGVHGYEYCTQRSVISEARGGRQMEKEMGGRECGVEKRSGRL